MRFRPRTLIAVLTVAIAAALLGTAPAATAGQVGHPHQHGRNDVYIMDDDSPLDTGDTPSPGDIYHSPDIWVCDTPVICPSPGVNPIAGQDNYVVVQLHEYGPGPVTGKLNLYYTNPSGGTIWPIDWIQFNSAALTVPGGGMLVELKWPKVPGPGHFCLLARWVSAADPMTDPETPDTAFNTRWNNNIAWHNVDIVSLLVGKPDTRQFRLGNPLDGVSRSSLVITAPDKPFVGPGDLTVDLGPTLYERWKANGAAGSGIEQSGPTQLRIVDPRKASIDNLALDPGEHATVTLTFLAEQPGASTVVVDQFDPNYGDLGGVRYDITVT
ncbi:hypothetical protein [Kutzneria sp. NPDC052558]|uniref:hypothetical protein n=1 Tax=Kutzneria sp. NPDC052558 TaxID=3364121 RepID=UPI0037C6DB2A